MTIKLFSFSKLQHANMRGFQLYVEEVGIFDTSNGMRCNYYFIDCIVMQTVTVSTIQYKSAVMQFKLYQYLRLLCHCHRFAYNKYIQGVDGSFSIEFYS